MVRKVIITSAAVILAGAGTIAAHAALYPSDEMVFLSSIVEFDQGHIDFCNYGDNSLSGAFISDQGHNVTVMFDDAEGTISITGAANTSGVITNGRVDDKGSFLFKGTLNDTRGTSADFVFSGVCDKNGTNKPKPTPKPTPKPKEMFSLSTASGKYNFSGNKITRCVYGKNVVFAEFIGSKGDVVDVKVSDSTNGAQGTVALTPAKGKKMQGNVTEGRVNNDGEFSLYGTLKVSNGEKFIFSGKCPKTS